MKNWNIFEYGGGGSTLYFSTRVKEVITVEHDTEWFGILSNKMTEKGRTNWKGFHILPEKLTIKRGNFEDPTLYLSTDENYLQNSFQKYASAIDDFENFDMILVDGRARNSCILHALPKLKSGSFLIIDNAERLHYTKYFEKDFSINFETILEVLAPVPYNKFISKTLILKKK